MTKIPDSDSGSFPSVKSREQRFFYGHPQNRFWRVLPTSWRCPVPRKYPEKKDMLLSAWRRPVGFDRPL